MVPACDDGVVVARGELDGKEAVVLAVEGLFQGGGIGEVSGAKIAGALELALRDAERGRLSAPCCSWRRAASGCKRPTSGCLP